MGISLFNDSMPQRNGIVIKAGSGVAAFILLGVLAVASAGETKSGFFSAPQAPESFAETVLQEGQAFLEQKSDAFDSVERTSGLILITPEQRHPGTDGGYMLELRGYFDSSVKAAVDYDSGAGYQYAAGDVLTMRLYGVALFDIAADGGVRNHYFKPLALQNMSNPRSRDEQFSTIKRLAAKAAFSDEDRRQLVQSAVEADDQRLASGGGNERSPSASGGSHMIDP